MTKDKLEKYSVVNGTAKATGETFIGAMPPDQCGEAISRRSNSTARSSLAKLAN